MVRISASDWAQELGDEGSEETGWKWWGIEQSKIFVGELEKLGVDMVDVSSGGQYEKQNIDIRPGYQVSEIDLDVRGNAHDCPQVPFAEAIKRTHPSLLISSVGLITSPTQAEEILQSGAADAVSLARELLRTPYFAAEAAEELKVGVKVANQYERGWVERVPGREANTKL
jgi:2,4-dienoyl-CoA reductase-like NADH-dependent reductase (Old Yellow Enzyme family)